MECISVCPDTALPNTSQDLSTVLTTAVSHYVGDPGERTKMMREASRNREADPPAHGRRDEDRHAAAEDHPRSHRSPVDGFSAEAKPQFY